MPTSTLASTHSVSASVCCGDAAVPGEQDADLLVGTGFVGHLRTISLRVVVDLQ
jgi:hypothetical protein